MNALKQTWRLIYINYVLARSGLDKMVVSIDYFSSYRFIAFLNPWNWFRTQPIQRGVVLRETLEQLGPIFIKFGQALSTRPDIVPPDIMLELCKLQDNVPPFASEEVIKILNQAYQASPYTVFDNFDPIPLASASIAQVHTANLKSGEEVVIKILRPNIRKIIDRDLAILKKMAALLNQHWRGSKYLRPLDVVAEFERHLLDELNLQREAGNATQLKRNFQQSDLLYVPKIYWEYTCESAMVMERIHGIPVTDKSALRRAGIDLKRLAERGLEVFFTQVFRDCYFHADMHPGNVFVSPDQQINPQYILIDCGIMGTLSENDKRYLAENLYAFFNRDYRRIALLHIESEWVPRTTRVEEFEASIRTVCEPVFEKPLKDISFAFVITQLLLVARRFRMVIQPQLILLQKTLFAVEGLGRQLDPELNVWVTGKPFLERWMREQMGPKAFFKHMRENIPFMIEQLPYMPRLINDVLLQLREQKTIVVEKENSISHSATAKEGLFRGFGLGVFLCMSIMAGLSISNKVHPQAFTLFAIGAACAGAILAWIRPKLRSE